MSKTESSLIKELDSQTINQIAAGEVVERPASVVKELVENAIDAKATKILVSIENYGLDKIQVKDNGMGMSSKDALLAWKPHTTSKIQSAQDLDAILTLGFRGEALASIASISEMEILTKREKDPIGTNLLIKGGKLHQKQEQQCTPGTIITIRRLFYNVPARKKFLKTPQTELGHITEIVSRLAIAHPQKHISLEHNGSTLFTCPSSKKRLDPIISIFGLDFAKKLLPVDFSEDNFSITGFIAKPELSRSNRDFEIFFVNNRFIKSTLLSESIEEAYKTLLMKHRFPVVILNIHLEPTLVDVNIHPTKREIRFDSPKKISKLITNCITTVLSHHDLWKTTNKLSERTHHPTKVDLKQVGMNVNNSTGKIELDKNMKAQKQSNLETSETSTHYKISPNTQLTFRKDNKNNSSIKKTEQHHPLISKSNLIFLTDDFWLRPLGQVLDLYILCETNEGIAIVDIHAAHERIRYEQLSKQYQEAQVKSQNLLQPVTLTLSTDQKLFLEKHLPSLLKIGFDCSFLDKHTLVVRKLPVSMDIMMTVESDLTSFIDEARKEIKEVKKTTDRIDLLLKTMACHSAVRGGDILSLGKINAILRQLKKCQKPFTCPHGRPIIIKITQKDLEKEFKRIV